MPKMGREISGHKFWSGQIQRYSTQKKLLLDRIQVLDCVPARSKSKINYFRCRLRCLSDLSFEVKTQPFGKHQQEWVRPEGYSWYKRHCKFTSGCWHWYKLYSKFTGDCWHEGDEIFWSFFRFVSCHNLYGWVFETLQVLWLLLGTKFVMGAILRIVNGWSQRQLIRVFNTNINQNWFLEM